MVLYTESDKFKKNFKGRTGKKKKGGLGGFKEQEWLEEIYSIVIEKSALLFPLFNCHLYISALYS